MFALRKITSEGVQINIALGRTFTLVDSRRSPEKFEKDIKLLYPGNSVKEDKTYAILSGEECGVIELFTGQDNYIVTDTGKTFSNITYKE